jgi:phenylacetate-CoA ligase
VLRRRGSLDHVTLEAEAAPGLSSARFEALARDLAHRVKSTVGITVEVVVLPPGALPRSLGKAVRVRDLRLEGV